MKDKAWASPRVSPNNEHFGRFFATYNLTGRTEGTLNIYIRLKQSKHYEIYERRAFENAAQAGHYLNGIEPSAQMFVIDPFFK